MLNEILDAVTNRVKEVFGEDAKIHTGDVKQGLSGPCFFVKAEKSEEKPMMGRRLHRDVTMRIRYLPGDAEAADRESNRAADLLTDGMEYITLADESRLRGTGKVSEMADGMLSFSVRYGVFLIREGPEQETMEQMAASAGLKEV